MKIYTADNIEADSVEILLNYRELKQLVCVLMEFEDKVKQFKMKNKKASGFTHLHLKDSGLIGKDSETDIVFYLDLNEQND